MRRTGNLIFYDSYDIRARKNWDEIWKEEEQPGAGWKVYSPSLASTRTCGVVWRPSSSDSEADLILGWDNLRNQLGMML